MAKNLRLGSKLIRISLIVGVIVSLAGLYCAYDISGTSDMQSARGLANVIFIAFFVDALILAGVLLMLAARKLVTRVNVLSAAMNQGAEGDLTAQVPVESDDEFGMLNASFNAMMERLADMANRISSSTVELRRITDNVRQVSEQGGQAAEIQSEGVKRTAGAVHEIDRTVNEVAQSVESLSRSAAENASSIMEMSASIEEVSEHVEALTRAVEEVSASIIEMAAAEKQIGASITSLMEDAARTSSLVVEMDASIKQVEKSAMETAAISEGVLGDAETGRETVEATISGIGEIRNSSRTAFEAIENLSSRAGDIGSILSVIDDVAEQTNLLALNASIIAAQAGEHGKGFAVVANEIKDLAKRTSSSTREISTIISGVQDDTERAVKAISLSEKRIIEGEELSQRSGEALNQIVAGVKMATSQVNEIAQTAVEQAQGSRNMRQAMERVAEMVTQIVKATREQGQGTEMIMGAVEEMKSLTGQVRKSTREQGSSGELIVRSTEGITRMIANIRQASLIQSESSQRIVGAMENIQDSTRDNVEATRVMESAVSGLSRQIEVLEQEMSRFRT